jgi:hypothetical protein
MICCSDAEGESRPMRDTEAEVMMNLAKQWKKLDPETAQKPEPRFEIFSWDDVAARKG